jgi:hypothetical protein
MMFASSTEDPGDTIGTFTLTFIILVFTSAVLAGLITIGYLFQKYRRNTVKEVEKKEAFLIANRTSDSEEKKKRG